MSKLKSIVIVSFVSFTLFFSDRSASQENYGQSIASKNYEVYVHPKIEDLDSLNGDLAPSEEGIILGMIHTVALLFEFYDKDVDFYFLARDAEYIYDVARVLARGNKNLLSRLHLINVSTSLSFDSLLRQYLSQNGISEKSLSKGRRVAFVETGFMGSVPFLIMKRFPQAFENQFETILLDSHNEMLSSVRSFKDYSKAEDLEQFPHYTKAGILYFPSQGKLFPVSKSMPKGKKIKALNLMKKIKGFVESKKGQKAFVESINYIKQIKSEKSNFTPKTRLARAIEADMKNLNKTLALRERSVSARHREYMQSLSDGRWSEVSGQLDDLENQLGIETIAQEFLRVVSLRQHKNSPMLNRLFLNISERIDYSDFELLEAMVMGYLSYLIEGENYKLNQNVIRQLIAFEGEESLEKMVWVLSRLPDKKMIRYEGLLIDIVRSARAYSEPFIILNLISRNILTPKRISSFKNLSKVFIDEIGEEPLVKWEQEILDTWSLSSGKIDMNRELVRNIFRQEVKSLKSLENMKSGNRLCREIF